MSIVETITLSQKDSPCWRLFEDLETFFTPLPKNGCYHYRDIVYFELEPTDGGFKDELARFHMVLLKRIWVPPELRGDDNSKTAIEILQVVAKTRGVGLLAISNPFRLSNRGRTTRDYQRIFQNDEGFLYPESYKLQQKKQRERFLESGFQNYQNDYTRRRNKHNPRISKKDWFVSLPESMAEPFQSQIKQTMFLPYKDNDNRNE